MSNWNDELREEVVKRYVSVTEGVEDPGEAHTLGREEVARLANEMERTQASIQSILTRAGVYIPKKPTASTTSASGTKTPRVSKAAAIEDLTVIIRNINPELVDDAILSKLTGKAAQYFAQVLTQSASN